MPSSTPLKHIDLTHILLAILIGLLICSLLNGVIIEGIETDSEVDPGAGGGPSTNASKTPVGSLNPGYCKGLISLSDTLCGHLKTEPMCTNDGEGICTWGKTDDIYSYSGGLEGSIYYDWMKSLVMPNGVTTHISYPSSGAPPIISPELTNANDTDLLPLLIPGRNGRTMEDDKAGKDDDFLTMIDVKYASDVKASKLIPENLKNEVYRVVTECERGWDVTKLKDEPNNIYNYNYGRPIMGYNASDGLVCKNPYNYPITQPGNVPRIQPGGAGYGCPSPDTATKLGYEPPCEKRTAECNWDGEGITSGITDTIYNNLPFSSGGECGLDSCAGQYPGPCAKTNFVNGVKDSGTWVWSILPNPPGY